MESPVLPVATLLSRPPKASGFLWAVLSLGVMVVFSEIYWNDLFDIGSLLGATSEQVFGRGEIWRLFTAVLVHGDAEHLLSNSVFFAILAFLLHSYFGAVVFPVMSLVAGALIHAITLKLYPPGVHLVGASGVVYFMAAFWVTLFVWIERAHPITRRLVIAAGFSLSLFAPTHFEFRVSYLAHGVGFAVGAVFGVLFFALNWRKIRAAERFKIDEDPQYIAIASGMPEALGEGPVCDGVPPRLCPSHGSMGG